MSTTRKLLVAALLVAGGYAVSYFVGRGSDLLRSPQNPQVGAAREGGWFAGLRSVVASENRAAEVGQLVPEAPGANGSRGTVAARRAPDAPIWLTATSEPKAATAAATQPGHADAPVLSHAEPPPALPSLPTQMIVDASPATPTARITNVVAAGSDAARRDASTWDRWPRWNSSDSAHSKGAVAATFQETPSATMVPVSYDAAVIARNSPKKDSGPAPETDSINRTHIVVDGDSLKKLADRYLDDPSREDEIYRLNRDILNSPDLLPIGVELRIPDARTVESQSGPLGSQFGPDDARTASNMVPVEWAPRPFEGPPRAELLHPVPAGWSD